MRPGDLGWHALTQKLPLLTEWINERAEGPGGRVSTTTLYEGADRGENASRVGSWIKGRWCLRTVELEEASAAFESARQGIRSAAVVGVSKVSHARAETVGLVLNLLQDSVVDFR